MLFNVFSCPNSDARRYPACPADSNRHKRLDEYRGCAVSIGSVDRTQPRGIPSLTFDSQCWNSYSPQTTREPPSWNLPLSIHPTRLSRRLPSHKFGDSSITRLSLAVMNNSQFWNEGDKFILM